MPDKINAYAIENLAAGGFIVYRLGDRGGSLAAFSAIDEALEFISGQFGSPRSPMVVTAPKPKSPPNADAVIPDWNDIPVDELIMSGRSTNALSRAGILTLGELCSKSDQALLALDGLGKKSLAEIRDVTRPIIAKGWVAYKAEEDERWEKVVAQTSALFAVAH